MAGKVVEAAEAEYCEATTTNVAAVTTPAARTATLRRDMRWTLRAVVDKGVADRKEGGARCDARPTAHG
ncbi:hypothetical protein GCM10022243_55500 [Saccharothrix violaceirubra]